MLTPSELDALRRDQQQAAAFCREYFANDSEAQAQRAEAQRLPAAASTRKAASR